MREAGLTTSEVLLDSRQERFVARLANLPEGSKLKALHKAPIGDCSPVFSRVIKKSANAAVRPRA